MNRLNIISISLVLVFLSGCATFGQLERGLNTLTGQNVQTAFDVLGYPSGKQEFGSDTVYYWEVNSSGTVILPAISSTSGYAGMTPIYGTTTYNQVVPVSYNCLIKLVADDKGIINTWEYSGNYGGCASYINKLNRYCKNTTSPNIAQHVSTYKPSIASKDKLSKLSLRMTSAEVQQILGKPYGRRTSNTIYRIYSYCFSSSCKEICPVILKNDRLIGWGDDLYNKLIKDRTISEH